MSILDRYLLRQLLGSLLLCLGTVLVALLMERLLRLFDILAQNNQALPAVGQLIVCLIPHYLGLALPAAFFVALFIVIARLGDNNEIDAYLAGGLSITRLTRPFLLMSLLLMLLSAGLFGYVQPHARYAYRAVLYGALNAGWNTRLQAGAFVDAGNGYTLSAARVDGEQLGEVFIHRDAAGMEELITSDAGRLRALAGSGQLLLSLERGQLLRDEGSEGANRGLTVADFERLVSQNALKSDASDFRPRGNNERELTFDELYGGRLPKAAAPLSEAKQAGELQGRLARTLSLPLLPLLAVPLGMSAKRGKRTASLIVAATLMLLFNNVLQFGESLAESGKVPALIGVWLPWSLFAALCVWVFSQSLARPGDNPVTRLLNELEYQVSRRPRFKAGP
ncbi:MAG: LptF/LptG family permease [Stagnimonas sp.]|nr:LptF/LptG family permease [Stagnimonas sp.]